MADGGTITPALSPKTLPTSHPDNHSDHPVAAYTPTEVAAHNRTSDSWIIIDKNVYNITEFQAEHPGGDRILRKVAGTDASKEFHKYHRESVLNRYQERLQVGVLNEAAPGVKKGFLRRLFKS